MRNRNKTKTIIFIAILTGLFFCKESFAVGLDICGRIQKDVKSLKEIRSKNIVKQSLDYSCGPASLATLLSYYFDDKVTEADILESLLSTTSVEKIKAKKGFSLLDLKRFAVGRGYDVVGYKMDLEFLVELDKPVLVPVNIKEYSHFVIFRGLKGDRVFLADPVLGNMTMKADKFLKIWQAGIGLVLSKNGEKHLRSPLALHDGDKAIYSDSFVTRHLFGINSLGKIFADGEF